LIVAGFDVATVSRWVGHSRASTTLDRYVKPLRQHGVAPAASGRVNDDLSPVRASLLSADPSRESVPSCPERPAP
jgi:hypothetical protein